MKSNPACRRASKEDSFGFPLFLLVFIFFRGILVNIRSRRCPDRQQETTKNPHHFLQLRTAPRTRDHDQPFFASLLRRMLFTLPAIRVFDH